MTTRRGRGRPPHPDILTPREWEVLALLRERLTNEEIAARLDVSLATAKYHVSEIISKLGVATREEAAAWQPGPEPVTAWWRRLVAPLSLAKAAGAAAMLAAAAGLAVLAWGVLRTSGEDNGAAVGSAYASTHDLSYVASDGSVYLVPADGSGRRLLFQHDSCRNAALSWSSTGERLLCQSLTRDVSVTAALFDASGNLLSTIEGMDYALFYGWAPGGRAFAYPSGEVIFVRDASGQVMVELALGSGRIPPVPVAGRPPFWSPDGKHFVYRSSDSPEFRIYSLDQEQTTPVPGDLRPLAWMSDLRSILVAQNYEHPDENGIMFFDVGILHLADGSVSQLPELSGDREMWLSPDTSKAAILTTGPDGLPGLGVYDFPTRELRVIGDSRIGFPSESIPAENVHWSKDGAEILWVDMSLPQATVYAADAESTSLHTVRDFPQWPFLSPDLRSAVYEAIDNNETATLYVSDLDGGEPIVIDSGPHLGRFSSRFQAAWRPALTSDEPPPTLKPPDASVPDAGTCEEPPTGEAATIIFEANVFSTHCLSVLPSQRLRVANVDHIMWVRLGRFEELITPGIVTSKETFGEFLEPGVHTIESDAYGEGDPVQIWLVEEP